MIYTNKAVANNYIYFITNAVLLFNKGGYMKRFIAFLLSVSMILPSFITSNSNAEVTAERETGVAVSYRKLSVLDEWTFEDASDVDASSLEVDHAVGDLFIETDGALEGNKSLRIGNYADIRCWNKNYNTNSILIEFTLKIELLGGNLVFCATDAAAPETGNEDTGGAYAAIVFEDDNMGHLYTLGDEYMSKHVASLQLDTTYTLGFLFTKGSAEYSVFINGEYKPYGTSQFVAPVTNITALRVDLWSDYLLESSVIIDDYRVSSVKSIYASDIPEDGTPVWSWNFAEQGYYAFNGTATDNGKYVSFTDTTGDGNLYPNLDSVPALDLDYARVAVVKMRLTGDNASGITEVLAANDSFYFSDIVGDSVTVSSSDWTYVILDTGDGFLAPYENSIWQGEKYWMRLDPVNTPGATCDVESLAFFYDLDSAKAYIEADLGGVGFKTETVFAGDNAILEITMPFAIENMASIALEIEYDQNAFEIAENGHSEDWLIGKSTREGFAKANFAAKDPVCGDTVAGVTYSFVFKCKDGAEGDYDFTVSFDESNTYNASCKPVKIVGDKAVITVKAVPPETSAPTATPATDTPTTAPATEPPVTAVPTENPYIEDGYYTTEGIYRVIRTLFVTPENSDASGGNITRISLKPNDIIEVLEVLHENGKVWGKIKYSNGLYGYVELTTENVEFKSLLEQPDEAPTEIPTEQPTATPDEPPATEIVYGDATGNSKINMADVVAIRRYLVNSESYRVAVLANADVNKDGKVNMADVVAIRRYLVNAEKYPLG